MLVQIVVPRRCNLACGYCYEYDKVSKPVPLPELKARVDALRKLKTVFVTLNGGEPLLHPHIAELVRYIVGAGLAHLCQAQTGLPAKPLADYSVADIRRQFQCGKTCAARCPLAYAHLGSRLDGFRRQPAPRPCWS